MHKKNIFSDFLVILLVLFFLFALFSLNLYFREPNLYGGQVFLIQFTAPWQLLAYIILIIILVLTLEMVLKKITKQSKRENISLNFIFICVFAFLFKLVLYQFSLSYGDASETIKEVFVNGEFNDYKLYNYMIYYISKLTTEYNVYLFLINILLGSLSIGLLFLIFHEIDQSLLKKYLVPALALLYLPMFAIETMLRVDVLYMFLFFLSIYFSIKVMKNDDIKYILFLNLALFLSCLCREQTLYMLPLFLVIILFANNNKNLKLGSIIITVVLTSLVLSGANKENYGMASKYKNFHLIDKMMHYGYLNEEVKLYYKNKLSDGAKLLLNDIDENYKLNVLPHKREDFNESHLSSGLTGRYWFLIRPDYENIATKSNMTPYKGNLDEVKEKLIKSLDGSKSEISLKEINYKFDATHFKDEDTNNLSVFIKSFITKFYLSEDVKLDGQGHCKIPVIKNSEYGEVFYSKSCVVNITKSISHKQMINRSDRFYYIKPALNIGLNFDEDKKKYIQHDNIEYLEEIILSMPKLYITQSTLVLFSMTGWVPRQTVIGDMNKIYLNNMLSKLVVLLQPIYIGIINYWYVFSFLASLFTLVFIKNREKKILMLVTGIIPLYYGSFLVFAAHGEFVRLMLPIIPFIIYNFFAVILFMTKNIRKTI